MEPTSSVSHGGDLHLGEDDPRDAVSAVLRAAGEFPLSGVGTPCGLQTYPDLVAQARRILTGLRRSGVRAGDHAVVAGLPLPRFFPVFWACLLGGVKPVVIADPPVPGPARDRLMHVWDLLDRPAVITDTAGLGIATIDPGQCEDDEEAEDVHRPAEDDVALLMLSSGSTGAAKAAQLTHRALAELAAGSGGVLGIAPESVSLNWLPVDHSGALLLFHVTEVFRGCTNHHLPTEDVLADPLTWLDAMAAHRVTHAWAPTFGFQLAAHAVESAPGRSWDLNSVRSLTCGGEQIHLAVVERFFTATAPFGLERDMFVPTWGMAETTTGITHGPLQVRHALKSSLGGALRWTDGPGQETSTFVMAGSPAPGAAIRIVDGDGAVLPEGRIGRLQVSGGRMTTGYVNNAEATRAVLPGDGTWLNTGDLAFVAGGALAITGREKDVIILNGHNVMCHEVEEVAGSVDGVPAGGVGACGVPNPATGTDDLVVFFDDDGTDTARIQREVKAAVFTRLRLTAARVVPVPSADFPRTGSGKVRRSALRDRDRDRPDVRAVAAELLGREVDEHTPFYDLGLNSVALVRLKAGLEERLGVSIETTALFEHPTLAALTTHLADGPRTPAATTGDSRADTRIAIIGMAARFPGAPTIEQFWRNLRDGVDSVGVFADAGPGVVPAGGVLSDVDAFDAGFFGVSPAEARLTEPAHRLFLECAYQALEHGGHASPGAGVRVGVYAGSGMNLYGHQDRLEPAHAVASDVPSAMQATIGAEPDFLASRVAYRLGLTGPAIGVQTACSTSLVAVHLAVQGLLSGDADMALAGAAAVRIPQESGYVHFPGSVLSPSGRCRAFSAESDGTVGGNGVAAVLLKRLDRAIADGDTVHAVILGSAVNNDGTSKVGFAAPSVRGQVDVVREALRRAGVPGGTISYVEAHGTGTALGDPIEFEALSRALREDTDRTGFCTLGSVKPSIGHLDTCAGLAGLIKTVLMLRNRELVPMIGVGRPNPELRLDDSPFVLGTRHQPWTTSGGPRRAGVSALGVGGTNAHVVLEEAPEAVPAQETGPVVLPLSAHTPEALSQLTRDLREHLVDHPGLAPADVASTLALGRRHLPHRTAVVGRTTADLAAALASPPEPAEPGPVVFAFSGQDVVPELDAADFAGFPRSQALIAACDSPLAQPRLFAFQAALVEQWRALGVEPDVVVGHSLGEFAALYAAGALTFEDGLRLTTARGELMSATEPGGMVAVVGDLAVARRVATSSGTEIAAVNGPQACVLSGSAAAIEAATRVLEDQDLVCRRLGTDRAFHSALIEPVLPELHASASAVDWKPLRTRMISGLDGTDLSAVDADWVRRHARLPVRFDRVLSSVGDAGVFVEIGPGRVLSGIGRRALPGSRWVPSRGDDLALPTALAELHRSGATIAWSAVVSGRRVPVPGVSLRRTPIAGPVRRETAGADGLDLVSRLLSGQLDLAEVDPDRTFVELGADSLALMSVVRELQRKAGVRVPMRDLFAETDTPRKLAARVGPMALEAVPEPGPRPAEPREPVRVPDEPVSGGTNALIKEQLRITEQVAQLMARQLDLLGENDKTPAPAKQVLEPVTPDAVLPAPATPWTSRAGCDFSLYFFGDYPDDAEQDRYRLVTEAAKFADEHDFHAVWLPERHFHSFGALFPNPSVLAAALAGQTSRVRLHAGSVVLPLHHPLRVAEEWSVVDNLSGGRAGLCVASGWHAQDFVLAPENYGTHREELYSRLDTVRRLWAGEAVRATAGNGDVVEVRSHPRPVQEQPPLYVAVVGNPDSYRKAAEENLGVVTNLMSQTVDELAANIALYRRTRAEHGLDPAAGRVVVLVHTYLDDEHDAARAEAFEPFCAYLRSSLSLFDQVTNSLGVDIDLDETDEDDVTFLLEQAYQRYCDSRALIGSPAGCGKVVDGLLAAGADEIACFVDFGVTTGKVLAGLPALDRLRRTCSRQSRPATPAERRIWFLEQLHPGQRGYHEPKAIRFDGPLDEAALRGSLSRVIARHPALRSVFHEIDGVPHRVVQSDVDVDCGVVDCTGRSEEEALREVLRTAGQELFDLTTGPLLSARLLRFSPERHVLFLLAHHIVFDSASTAVFLRDLAAFYRSWPAPAVLPALGETADEERDSGEDVAFWRDRLAAAPELCLPTDRPRPAVRTGEGAYLTHELGGELAAWIRRFSVRERVTPFSTLLTAFATVLSRFSGQDDLVIGTAVSGRSDEDAIGMFVDTLPLRMDLTGDLPFPALARRLNGSLMDSYEHRSVSFDRLVEELNPERDPGRNPLFQILVEYENASAVDFDPPGLTAVAVDVPSDRAPMDLMLYLTSTADDVRCVVEYDSALFYESTVRRMFTCFEHVLRAAMHGLPPGLTDEDADLLGRWEGERTELSSACLHDLVDRANPDAPAVLGPLGSLTYRELDERSNQVAHSLIGLGAAPGTLVGVHLRRSPEQVVALLGILKSGAAFLPLDPSLPAERLRFLAEDSSASILLTSRDLPPITDVPVLFVEDLGSTADGPPRTAGPDDLAYCIYTSGSTGRPKGVLVPHRGPVNLVRGHGRNHPPTRTLQWVSLSFDVSVYDIFTTLASGAALVLVDEETRFDPAAVAELMRAHSVERVCLPFTPLLHLLESNPSLPSLREIVSVGEPTLPTPAVHDFLASHPDCVLYNAYGPTEASVLATIHPVARGEDRPPIGRPLDGVRVKLLDDAGERVPVGAIGEICLEGVCVADGYLNRPDETAAAFVAPELYRTGDRGRWRADGLLEFHGRTDDQVKIRGSRVEPGETRHALLRLAGVRDAAVVVRDGELVAYVVTDEDHGGLESSLSGLLPPAQVPRRWVRVERLPLSPNGKLATSALPEPALARATPPASELERTLLSVWRAVLDRDDIGVDQSFFSVGGHSLTMIRLLSEIRARTGAEVSMAEFLLSPTIRGLAGKIVDRAPLTYGQQRLWQRHHARGNPSVYNIPFRVDVDGPLDLEAVRRALRELTRRHAALRTRFSASHQEVLPHLALAVEVDALPGDEAGIDRWFLRQAAEEFDLTTAPLFRVRVGRIADDRWVLALVFHHMIFDGWSAGVFWQELQALYEGTPLPPPSAQHPDHARRERAAADDGELTAFWRGELAGATLHPDLPCDEPRPERLSGAGALVRRTFGAAAVHAAASASGTTPNVVITEVFARWLAEVTGRRDVVLAVSSSRRTLPEHSTMIGYVGEAVLVRIGPGEDVATRLYSALDHQALPLSEVVRTAIPHEAGTPYPAVLFTVVTTPPPAMTLGTARTTIRGTGVPGQARTELYVVFTLAEEEITVEVEYSTDLFHASTVGDWVDLIVSRLS
ncbi:non-ribosomal peptide synthetase/type I polyketide synthase [Lentzea sp. HUAS12]|uniref:non-ribosomal peptide synthetase/type I polyketide synthase n=1 Tax=Lentzea sp. HUAS12 TaxID=2951806 RepID=UPI00209D3E4B|nr:MupA/Atu3671 family FMN-dependent luciferase-like monooxygenase [Lentzea sp. HUAS12]USX53398.1 amino acid adenylation domain-containing protein [Lentzea sp. HUAS12]